MTRIETRSAPEQKPEPEQKQRRLLAKSGPALTKKQRWSKLIQMLTRARALLWEDYILEALCKEMKAEWCFQELIDNDEFKLAADELILVPELMWTKKGMQLTLQDTRTFHELMIQIYKFLLEGEYR